VPRIFPGRAHQAGSLLQPDGPIRRPVFIRLSGLYFDEHQRFAFPADQVHLSSARRHAVITIHDRETGALQEAMGNVFAAPSKGVIIGHVPLAAVAPEKVGELIKLAEHKSAPSGKCAQGNRDLQ